MGPCVYPVLSLVLVPVQVLLHCQKHLQHQPMLHPTLSCLVSRPSQACRVLLSSNNLTPSRGQLVLEAFVWCKRA